MSVDKLVDSTLLDAACTYEAGKIREKLGSSAQIAYDLANGKGFGDAIAAIPSGGGGISIEDLISNTEPSGAITLSSSITSIARGAFRCKPITSIYAPEVTMIYQEICQFCSQLKKAKFPKLTSVGNNNWGQFQESGIEYLAMPKLSGNIGANLLQACTSLIVVDAGVTPSIQTRATANAKNFNTLILRKTDAITALANVDGIASDTKFKSGGAGGTVYIPEVLYNHLGDGTSLDYKAATNWSTVNGYGTITWAKLEGSIYESEDWLQI